MRIRTLIPLIALALAGFSPALSQVVLKPNGQNAVPLRLKALTEEVKIHGQFARSTLQLTFQNESWDRVEADFIYTLPQDTLVSSFAYWYGDEKVKAKIVEKEEAAAIYAHITARQHDPALVEMIGKRTFRARIFPVMPNSDLRVEMTLVQTLSSTPKGAILTIPIRQERGVKLDSVDIRVRAAPDSQVDRVVNNFDLPVHHGSDGWSLKLRGENYRPQADLRVTLVRPQRTLQLSCFAAPSGGNEGFFAIAATPDLPLSSARLVLQGLSSFETVGGAARRLAAHRALTLFGRYRSPGAGTVVLVGLDASGKPVRLSAPVRFGTTAIANNPASILWAAARIDALGGNRRAAMHLSFRFGLPCRYTSWLAVPQQELQRYWREKAEGQAEAIAARIADARVRYGRSSPAERRLWQRLVRICRDAGLDPGATLGNAAASRGFRLSNQYRDLSYAGKEKSRIARRIRSQYEALARISPPGYFNPDILRTRVGDPLIRIDAPADAQQVIAILPDGRIVPLRYMAAQNCWQARFDVPGYAVEAQYTIRIIIVLRDGTRRFASMSYQVDTTPPNGKGWASLVSGSIIRLDVGVSPDTARVKALMPWGKTVELRPGAQQSHFVALVRAPTGFVSGPVRYILVDRAHNRTTLDVDMREQAQ
jgi:hypothetical protein